MPYFSRSVLAMQDRILKIRVLESLGTCQKSCQSGFSGVYLIVGVFQDSEM